VNSKAVWADFFKALKNSNWNEAIKQIDILIEDESRNSNHYLKRGDISQKQGDKNSAIKAYLKAATILGVDGFQKKAGAVYKMILRLDPGNKDALEGTDKLLSSVASQGKPFLPSPGDSLPAEKDPFATGVRTDSHEPDRLQKKMPALDALDMVIEQTAYDSESSSEVSSGDRMRMGTGLEETASIRTDGKTDAEDFLGPFNIEEIEEVLKRSAIKKYVNGESVVKEGDAGDSVYIVKDGSAHVVAHIRGKEIDLASLNRGDMFGEVAYITGRPRTAEVVASGDLEVYEITRILLDDIIERRPEIMTEINEIYMSRVKDTIRKVKE